MCEQFFRSQGTPPAQQVWTVAFYLEGAVDKWYYRLEKNHIDPSWADFVDGINKRFGPPARSNPLVSSRTSAAPGQSTSTRRSS
jgi:hypothetical protein